MMAESELTDKLLEIAESDLAKKVRESPSSFTLKQRLSDGSITMSEIAVIFGDLIEYINQYRQLFEISSLFQYMVDIEDNKKVTFPIHLLKQNDYFTNLSLSIIDHDLNGPLFAVNNIGEHIKMLLEFEEEEKLDEGELDTLNMMLKKDSHSELYDLIKIASTIIPYVALGDSKHLIALNAESVRNIFCLKIPFSDFNVNQNQMMRSDETWILYQLAKNARKAIVRSLPDDVLSYNKLSLPNRKIEISTSYEKDEVRLVVSDDGCGIQPEVLPLIFGVYTTSGTGLGLQIVKRLVDLRKGDAKVISTTEAGDSYQYDLNSNTLKKLDDKRERGTTFEVYLKNTCK